MNLCRTLSDAGFVSEVVAFDNLSTGDAANLDGLDVRLIEGTILDPGALDGAFASADAVVDLAARPSVPK